MRILKEQFSNDLRKFLTVPNRNALKAYHSWKINKFTYNKQRTINLYKECGDYVFVPLSVVVTQDIKSILTFNVPKDAKNLYDYQDDIIKKAEKINSWAITFILWTWRGKSIIISHLILQKRTKTLILLPTITLLKQQKAVLEEFGIDVWMYWNNKKELKDITVMTNQSLSQLSSEELSKLDFDILIVDELQKALWPKVRDAILQLEIKAMYWFSATPYSASMNNDDVIRFFWENVKDDVTANILPTIYAVWYKNPYRINMESFTSSRTKTLDKDNKRLDKQLEVIESTLLLRKAIIVLHDRTAHTGILYEKLKDKHKNIYMLTGKMKDKDRDTNLDWFKKNWGVLFASKEIADTGLDAPIIDTVCLFFPNKFDWKIIQAVWRALRKNEGKKDAIVIDWCDMALIHQYRARVRVYKKEYGIKQIENIDKLFLETELDI